MRKKIYLGTMDLLFQLLTSTNKGALIFRIAKNNHLLHWLVKLKVKICTDEVDWKVILQIMKNVYLH